MSGSREGRQHCDYLVRLTAVKKCACHNVAVSKATSARTQHTGRRIPYLCSGSCVEGCWTFCPSLLPLIGTHCMDSCTPSSPGPGTTVAGERLALTFLPLVCGCWQRFRSADMSRFFANKGLRRLTANTSKLAAEAAAEAVRASKGKLCWADVLLVSVCCPRLRKTVSPANAHGRAMAPMPTPSVAASRVSYRYPTRRHRHPA